MKKNQTYTLNKLRAVDGIEEYRKIVRSFDKGPEINLKLLRKLLKENKNTEYGKK